MKCMECGLEKGIHCRGMCAGCYTRWKRAGKPPTRFDYRTPVEKFKKDCDNGIVLGLLAAKKSHLDIARKYGIAESTARKHMEIHGLIVINEKSVKKKDRKGTFYDPARMLALAMPWVNNSSRASYYG